MAICDMQDAGVSSTAEDCGVPSNHDSLEKALTSTTQLPNGNTTTDALSLSIPHPPWAKCKICRIAQTEQVGTPESGGFSTPRALSIWRRAPYSRRTPSGTVMLVRHIYQGLVYSLQKKRGFQMTRKLREL